MIFIKSKIDLLIRNSSPPLGGDVLGSSDLFSSLLAKRNGFYSFFSALYVYPSDSAVSEGSLEWWNSDAGWKEGYDDELNDFTAFACDIFGGQFLLRGSSVFYFDPETSANEFMSNGIEDWARAVLEDSEYVTGYPLAKEWQERNGPLSQGCRLVPKTPFVLGGDFSVENLREMKMSESMKVRSRLANKIKNIPDGEKILLISSEE